MTKSKQMMKQRADSKQHVKKSEIQVGDKVLYRQQRLKKHTLAYGNEILRAIKRKGSLIVAKGETRTITRHVTFLKRLPDDLDADTPTSTLDQAKPAQTEVMTPPATPPMPEQVEDEEPQQGSDLPLAICPKERARQPQTTHGGGRPSRERRLPARFLDENFEYNSCTET